MRFVRWIAAFVVACLATYVLAVIANAQSVIAAHGVPVSLSDRFNMTAFDISNMGLYLVIIAVALLLGFAIAALVKRFLPKMARFAYPIAGAAALGMVLGLMYIVFQTIPISGARSALGFVSQVIAGGIGGWIFASVLGAPSSKTKTLG